MREAVQNWYSWWIDFWFEHPWLFAAAILIAVAVRVAPNLRRR